MFLPSNLQTGRVEWRAVADIIDGPDEDTEPDIIPAQGEIWFDAEVKYWPAGTAEGGPMTIVHVQKIAIIDSEGFLCSPDPQDPTKAGPNRFMRLYATNDPDYGVTGWRWKATPRLKDINGKPLTDAVAPKEFFLEAGTTLDLTHIFNKPLVGGPETPLLVAEGVAAAAAASASSAANSAEQSRTLAASVADRALANDAGVSELLVNGAQTSRALNAAIDVKVAPQADALKQKISKVEFGELSAKTDGIKVIDTSTSAYATFRYEDTAENLGSIMNLHHRGRGGVGAQAYGLNIANHVGAKSAFVIHQYSNAMAMIRLDNTDDNAAIQIYNTENQTMNPGRIGTGAFLDFKPWAETKRLRLLDSLVWLNETAKNVTFETATAANYGLGVKVTKDIPALFIHKASAGLGAGIAVTNDGTSPGVDVVQNGIALGLRLTAGPSHTAYIAQLRGQIYGTEVSTDADGGTALSVNKKGSGAGSALVVRNAGSGSSLQFLTGTATVARVSASGEYEHLLAGQGIILKSPNGTRHRVTVNDSGAVVATALSN